MDKSMVRERIFGPMENSMMGLGKMVKCMAKESMFG
jgi:hypothetical protein